MALTLFWLSSQFYISIGVGGVEASTPNIVAPISKFLVTCRIVLPYYEWSVYIPLPLGCNCYQKWM